MKRRTKYLIAAGSVVAIFAAVGGGVALAAATAPASNIYACVVGSSRVVERAYTVAGNFKGCPKGSFAVTVASGARGPAGPKGPAGPTGPAGPAGAGVLPFRSEVDNGTEYAVSDSGNLADTSASGATYSDAGIVVDDGQTNDLTTSDMNVTASGPVAENIWIGNGPQAATDGIYPLSPSADFCYGLGNTGTPPDTSFTMTGENCGAYLGQTLTLTQIGTDFPDLEAYTWAGVVSSGSSEPTVTITALGGKTGFTANTGIRLNSDGTLTPFVQS